MDVIKGLKIEYNEENIATSMSADIAIPQGLQGTFSAEMEKADRGEKLIIKINGEEYGVHENVKCEPTARRERFYDAITKEIAEMLEDLNIHEEIPMSLEQYAEWYGEDELELPQAKYKQYEDLSDVGDSMMFNHGTLLAELITPDGHKAELEVRGDVRVTTHDENGEIIATYRSFSEMPEKLKEKIRDGSYLDDESIYVGDSNWFELFYRGELTECVDVEHKTPEQIYELMAEWVNDFEKEYDRGYNLVPEEISYLTNISIQFENSTLWEQAQTNAMKNFSDTYDVENWDELDKYQKEDCVFFEYQKLKNAQIENSNETAHFLSDAEKMRDFKELTKEEFLASYSYLTEKEYDATVREVAQRIADFYDKYTDEPAPPTVDIILEEVKTNSVPTVLTAYVEDVAGLLDSFNGELSEKEIQAAEELINLLDKEPQTGHFLDDAEKMYMFKKYPEQALMYNAEFGFVTKAQYDATAREVATEIANFYEEFTDEPDKPTVEQILSEMKEHGVPQTLNNYAEDILDWRNAFKDELSAEEIQASKDVISFITNETAFTLHEKLTDKFDSMSFDSETQGIATIITPTGKEAYLDVRGEVNVSVHDAEGEILAEYKNFSEMPKDLQEKIADGSYLHDDSICVNNNNWFEFFYYDGDKLLANEVVDFKKGTPEEVYKQMASIINNVEPLAVPETINEAEGVNTTLIYEQPVNYFALTATERTKKTAEEFGITDKLEALTSDLMQIKGVVNVEYDLDGFWDNMRQVIFLPKYDIPVEADDYFKQRSEMLKNVLETAKQHGLTRTEDSIEDYGEHFYIVTQHDKSWLAKEDNSKEKIKKKAEIERD